MRDKWTCSAVSIAPLVSVTDLGTRCETAFGQLPRATALEVSPVLVHGLSGVGEARVGAGDAYGPRALH